MKAGKKLKIHPFYYPGFIALLHLLSGCFGGMLHYSKFQHYRPVNGSSRILEIEPGKSVKIEFDTLSYSQRWQYRYYMAGGIKIENTSGDTIRFDRSRISAFVDESTMATIKSVTATDRDGKYHLLRFYDLPTVYAIPPVSTQRLSFQVQSVKHYSEKEYQALFRSTFLTLVVKGWNDSCLFQLKGIPKVKVHA